MGSVPSTCKFLFFFGSVRFHTVHSKETFAFVDYEPKNGSYGLRYYTVDYLSVGLSVFEPIGSVRRHLVVDSALESFLSGTVPKHLE